MIGNSPAAQGNLGSRHGSKMRELADRVRRLERKKTHIFGQWALGEDEHGNLTATHNSGVVRVIARLEED